MAREGTGDETTAPRRLTRRRVFAVALGAAGSLGAALALVRSAGYAVDPAVRARLRSLAPWQYIVVQHLARRVCAADEAGAITADQADVAGFVDGFLAMAPAKTRRDMGRFLALIEQIAPTFARRGSRFTRLSAAEQDRVLAALEGHSNELLRGGFQGLKALLFMGYYRDPRTWSMLGYEGPLVGARAEYDS